LEYRYFPKNATTSDALLDSADKASTGQGATSMAIHWPVVIDTEIGDLRAG